MPKPNQDPLHRIGDHVRIGKSLEGVVLRRYWFDGTWMYDVKEDDRPGMRHPPQTAIGVREEHTTKVERAV